MCHKHIDTQLNLECKTFKDAIKHKSYLENECCINTLYDYYGDGLLNPNKKQKSYLVTRAMILETLGKTEDNVKDGIKIHELQLFFQKYNLQLRVVNEFCKVLFYNEPTVRNHHHKAMYCLLKGNHLYTLNNDIKSLEQKQDNESETVVTASSDFYKYEKAEPIPCKMISHIDDIVKIIKGMGETDDTMKLRLVHENEDLKETLHDLKEAGYEPQVRFICGIISNLSL
jgi:hypothetical protein